MIPFRNGHVACVDENLRPDFFFSGLSRMCISLML